MKRKYLFFLSLLLLVPTASYGAWPTDSSRSKTWGNETLTSSDLHGQFDIIHTWLNDAFNASSGHTHDGTTNQGPKIPLTSLTIGSQAQGDVIYASSASTWARLGAGTSGQFLKTQGAGANPTWATLPLPANTRTDLYCNRASTTTLTVSVGEAIVGTTLVSKTSDTTLTLTTAGDWAGGVSLQATNTTGYVGVDSAGNLKLHTTAPTHSDYGVSNTNGMKRYATWSGTVYRIIGWFRMNGTGSGELDVYGVSNFKDGNVDNAIVYTDAGTVTVNSSIPTDDTYPQSGEGVQVLSVVFVKTSPKSKIRLRYQCNGNGTSAAGLVAAIFKDSDTDAFAASFDVTASTSGPLVTLSHVIETLAVGTYTFKVRMGISSGSWVVNDYTFGGASLTQLDIQEI